MLELVPFEGVSILRSEKIQIRAQFASKTLELGTITLIGYIDFEPCIVSCKHVLCEKSKTASPNNGYELLVDELETFEDREIIQKIKTQVKESNFVLLHCKNIPIDVTYYYFKTSVNYINKYNNVKCLTVSKYYLIPPNYRFIDDIIAHYYFKIVDAETLHIATLESDKCSSKMYFEARKFAIQKSDKNMKKAKLLF